MNTAAAVAAILMMKQIRPTIMNITTMTIAAKKNLITIMITTDAVKKNIITMIMIVAVAKSITMNILI